MTRREAILARLTDTLATALGPRVRRNEALPETVPPAGLVIVRDGDPGEPDVTLNPRTEFYSHRLEIEVYLTRASDGSGEAALDALVDEVAAALCADPSVGGLAENLLVSAPQVGVLAIEGAAPVLTARLTVMVEYLLAF